MAFERRALWWLVLCCACASDPRFPLRPVMWRDDDQRALARIAAKLRDPGDPLG